MGVDAHQAGVWLAVAWAFALVLLQLRGGRRGWRRLTRRPGFAADLASLASLAVLFVGQLAEKLAIWARMGRPLRLEWADLHEHIFPLLTLVTPCTVAATWALLAIGGRWRPARDWVDRLGTLLGLYWVTWGVTAEALMLGV